MLLIVKYSEYDYIMSDIHLVHMYAQGASTIEKK